MSTIRKFGNIVSRERWGLLAATGAALAIVAVAQPTRTVAQLGIS